MRVKLFCNGEEALVSPFIARFTSNVCKAVADSLKAPAYSRSIRFSMKQDRVHLEVDDMPVSLDRNQAFGETIVCDTLKGMLQHLKGIDPNGVIRIEVELENEKA